MWATATTALDHRDTDLSRDKIMLKIIAFSDLLTARAVGLKLLFR